MIFELPKSLLLNPLGVTMDDNLEWRSHMEKIIKKVSSGIGAIKRVRHLVSKATLQLVYQALIHPHFNYCNTGWENCGITLRNKLQKLQNRAPRVLTFSDYDEDLVTCLNCQGWKILASAPAWNWKSHDGLEVFTRVGSRIFVLGLQYEKRLITLETLRINFVSLYHGQIITK